MQRAEGQLRVAVRSLDAEEQKAAPPGPALVVERIAARRPRPACRRAT